MKSTLTWAKFRYAIAEIEGRFGYSKFDPIVQRTLEWVAREERSAPVIYIQTIIMRSEVASPATLHKALTLLRVEGLLSIEKDKEDSRRRVVKTTAKAKNLFDRLGSELVKVAAGLR